MSRSASAKLFQPSQRSTWAGGQPISELMAQALAHPELISLAAGFVDRSTLPTRETREALDELFADKNAAQHALQYGTTLGDLSLRSALLDWTLRGAPPPAAPTVDQVVITSGSNQLLHLIAEVLFDPGDIVLCASPTYLVFLGTLANLGVRAIGLATDDHGMIPEALDEQLRSLKSSGELERVKAIYLIPYFDNPRGITMPSERVSAIVNSAQRWSTRHQIFVIADEAYRELRYYGPDLPSAITMDEGGQTVIVAGTFSKSFSPGIRVGWGILPDRLARLVAEVKGNIDFGSPNLNQVLMRRIVESGSFDKHVATIRRSYAEKLSAILDASNEFLAPLPGMRWDEPRGGLYVWAEVPAEIDTGPDGALFHHAIVEGVLYVPGQYAYATEGVTAQRNTMRLSFGVQPVERIRVGIAALAQAIRDSTT